MSVTMLAAGCGDTGQTSSEAPPTTAATTTTTTPPTLDTVSYTTEARAARAKGETPWFCSSQGVGGAMDNAGHAGHLANPVYAGKSKGAISADDCDKLAVVFDEIIAKVKPYRTRGAAKAAGRFNQSVQFVPGLGTHDTMRAGEPGGFATEMGEPPKNPMFLQYDGEGDDAPLAGLSWFVISGAEPPAGFPGDNDWWHTHSTLCFKDRGTVVANEVGDDECTKLGGVNQKLPGVWMSHAWIVPGYENRFDVFSGAFMCLKGTGKPPAPGDPCHDDRTDPEHPSGGHAGSGGHTPGMDHGGGGGEHKHTPGMDHTRT